MEGLEREVKRDESWGLLFRGEMRRFEFGFW